MKTYTVTVTDVGRKGDGLARLSSDEPVFVDEALTGETVDVQLYTTKDGVQRGRVHSLSTPSAQRQSPPCQHYQRCGGCQFQHMNEAAYRAWKIKTTQATLEDRAITDKTPPLTERLWAASYTRRRVTVLCKKHKGDVLIGYRQRRSHALEPITTCLLLEPQLMQAITQIRPYLAKMMKNGSEMTLFLQRVNGQIDCAMTGPLGQKGTPDYPVHDACARLIHSTAINRLAWRKRPRDPYETLLEQEKPFKRNGSLHVGLAPHAFLQPSHEGETALIAAVRRAVPKEAVRVADLFAGHGTFAGALLTDGKTVDVFEGDDASVSAVRSAGHQQAFVRDLFKAPLTPKELSVYDAVVLDPPRAGAKMQCLALGDSTVPSIAYVSCNVDTFARDAELLKAAGYRLKTVDAVDQFLWSTHIELIGSFSRK